ncbi:MAG: ROK family protein, partial [Kiritimatiellia bacterium]
EHAGSDPVNLRSGTLAAAIENGDEVIKKIVVDAFTSMGEVLGGVVNLLAPDILIIGGGLAEAMPKLILSTLKNSMAPKIMAPFQGSCQLRIANLGDHATALGAAAWAAEQEAI